MIWNETRIKTTFWMDFPHFLSVPMAPLLWAFWILLRLQHFKALRKVAVWSKTDKKKSFNLASFLIIQLRVRHWRSGGRIVLMTCGELLRNLICCCIIKFGIVYPFRSGDSCWQEKWKWNESEFCLGFQHVVGDVTCIKVQLWFAAHFLRTLFQQILSEFEMSLFKNCHLWEDLGHS